MVSSFNELVRDVPIRPDVNDVLLACAEQVERNYLILMTPRSGSSWLVGLLHGRLGHPGEFLNPDFVRDVATAAGTRDRVRYLRATQGHTSTGGTYGLKTSSDHLRWFGADVFFDTIGRPVTFALWRENLVAQAISIYRAVETNYFHSSEGARPADPAYDAAKLLDWLHKIAQIETDGFRLLRERDLAWHPLVYEHIVTDPDATLRRFYRALDLPVLEPLGVDTGSLLRKVTEGGWAAAMEARFRAEHADIVAEVYAGRLAPKLAPFTP
jgi:LPS sulfotransferase NodH